MSLSLLLIIAKIVVGFGKSLRILPKVQVKIPLNMMVQAQSLWIIKHLVGLLQLKNGANIFLSSQVYQNRIYTILRYPVFNYIKEAN